MYDLTIGQNGHFSEKPFKGTMCFSCPMSLVKMNILLVNVNTLNLDFVKLYNKVN
jgi:hypothetical protein